MGETTMKNAFICLMMLLTSSAFAATESYDHALATSNAYKAIQKMIPQSHQEFAPRSESDLTEIRVEKTGVIDFAYTSSNGRFRGDVYCHLSQLLMYSEKYSKLTDVCFRLNVNEFDSTAVNGFGKQVGIY